MVAISDPTGFVDSDVTLVEKLLDLGIEDALVMTGFDSCAIGILERFGQKETVVLYDKEKVLEQLIAEGCDSYSGALEYYEFNQLGGYHGDKTPGFLVRLPDAV